MNKCVLVVAVLLAQSSPGLGQERVNMDSESVLPSCMTGKAGGQASVSRKLASLGSNHLMIGNEDATRKRVVCGDLDDFTGDGRLDLMLRASFVVEETGTASEYPVLLFFTATGAPVSGYQSMGHFVLECAEDLGRIDVSGISTGRAAETALFVSVECMVPPTVSATVLSFAGGELRKVFSEKATGSDTLDPEEECPNGIYGAAGFVGFEVVDDGHGARISSHGYSIAKHSPFGKAKMHRCGFCYYRVSPPAVWKYTNGKATRSQAGVVAILSTGTYAKDKIPSEVSGPWHGLFSTDQGHVLREVDVRVEAGENEMFGADKTVSISSPDNPILLVSGSGRFTAGSVYTVASGAIFLSPGSKMVLRGLRGQEELVVGGAIVKEAGRGYRHAEGYSIGVRSGNRTQVLQAYKRFQLDLEEPEIFWIGDLDRDGKLDYLVDLQEHYAGTALGLFLSSHASSRELVGLAAAVLLNYD